MNKMQSLFVGKYALDMKVTKINVHGYEKST